MKIVCAPDSFKESMTASQAASAMEQGIHDADPRIEVVRVPMADGGEGTMQTLIDALDGEIVEVPCHDALHRSRVGRIGWIAQQHLAVIEVAEAVGLGLVAVAEREPRHASSRGVGDLVRAALDRGARRLVIGLGGTATNDGGAGMAKALGARLLDAAGRELDGTPDDLHRIAVLDLSHLDPRLAGVAVTIASDVTNPLVGANGATYTFGPQKGLSADELQAVDRALACWCTVLEQTTGRDVRERPGAGAAGGLGAALMALTDATVEPGVELVMRLVGLDRHLDGADLVFTGEGSIDEQTRLGKTPWGVAQAAVRRGVPAVLFGGRVAASADALLGSNVMALVPVTPGPGTLTEALAEAPENLRRAARMAAALLVARG